MCSLLGTPELCEFMTCFETTGFESHGVSSCQLTVLVWTLDSVRESIVLSSLMTSETLDRAAAEHENRYASLFGSSRNHKVL